MTEWKAHEIRKKLEKIKGQFGLTLPQVQLLLCHERFLARLYSLNEGPHFIWKGGSLILRFYQGLEKPRFTVDLDFLAEGIRMAKVETTFKKAINIHLEDGFEYFNVRSTPMERETPYGGERFEIDWNLFGRGQPESLKIDICAGDDVDFEIVKSQDLFLVPEQDLSLKVYPAEFIFAEKFETAVRFYTGNTRLKDFIDMYTLVKKGINPKKTRNAINRCLKRRETSLLEKPWKKIFMDPEFIEIMEGYRTRHFNHLNLPRIKEMFSEIEAFVISLGID